MRTIVFTFVAVWILGVLNTKAYTQIDPLLERARPSTTNNQEPQSFAGLTLKGQVLDSETNEPLPGAVVRVQNAPIGAVTDANGSFSIRLTSPGRTVIIISYTGYATKFLNANPRTGPVQIVLEPGEIRTEEVVVSASRVSQQLKEASVSITKLSMADIAKNPALNVYESFQQVKELEGLNVGIGYKVYNARGFLALINNRFLQRYDGIDMLIPGNNATVGNLVGIPDVDVQNAEILVGSASVLYGSTAINGLLNITSRSPFDFPGLTAQVRTGVSHLGNSIAGPYSFQELGIRYAKKFGNNWAAKVVLSGFQGQDWIADNKDDGANYVGTTNDFSFTPGVGNPGYDGTSIFGDESFVNFSYLNFFLEELRGSLNVIDNRQTILRVSRSGYAEQDLVNYNFLNYKGLFSIAKRFNRNRELSYTGNFGLITTMTPLITRDRLENFFFQHHKIDYSSERFQIRTYASLQSNPRMINLTATGYALNNSTKSDIQWFTQYLAAFGATNAEINSAVSRIGRGPYLAASDADARRFANSSNSAFNNATLIQLDPRAAYLTDNNLFGGGARLEPGTPEFDQALDSVKNVSTYNGGGRISDFTSFGNVEWQYAVLTAAKNKLVDVNVGGSMRGYLVRSFGSFYSDTPESGFTAYDYGLYVNALSRLGKGGINLNFSARMDGNQSIKPVFSPRIAATFNVDEGRIGFIRLSAQQTYRLPNLVQQFQDLNLGVYRQIGPSRGVPERYNLVGQDNNFTLASIQSYTSTFLSGESNLDILQTFDITELRPERITSLEFGFRTSMNKGATYLDFALFYNLVDDFIGLVPLVGLRPESASSSLTDELINPENLANYQVWTNVPGRFSNYGYSVGVDIAFSDKVRLNSNASYILFSGERQSTTVALIDLFNTPIFKANSLLTLNHFYKNLNFSVNHRWSDTYEFQVPSFSSRVAAFNVVDMALSYDFPGYQIKLGGTNVLNHYHVEIIYGPSIGAAYFLQVTIDPYLYPKRRNR